MVVIQNITGSALVSLSQIAIFCEVNLFTICPFLYWMWESSDHHFTLFLCNASQNGLLRIVYAPHLQVNTNPYKAK